MLAIDESEVSCLLHDIYFSHFDFCVNTAREGELALAQAHESPPDVVLVSLTLGGAVDAWEVIRRLRADPATQNTCIVALEETGGADLTETGRMAHALAAGADCFVCRPFMPDRLLAAVSAVLQRRASRPSSADSSEGDDDRSVRIEEVSPGSPDGESSERALDRPSRISRAATVAELDENDGKELECA